MKRLHLAAALLAALVALPAAQAQVWEYKSYKKRGGGAQYDKEVFTMGTISVEEKDGKAFFRMTAGGVDACLRGDIPAIVTKSDETTIVEPQIALSGCEKLRYVIRNDGSGGRRESWRNEAWKDTGWDHGLTPKK